MKRFLIGVFFIVVLVLATVSIGVAAARPPSSGVARGMFIFYGYDSPPWYPPGEETDSYRWAPKYHWADSSITVRVNPTASGFSSDEYDAVVAEVGKGFEVWDTASGPWDVTVVRDDYAAPSLDEPDFINTVSWGWIDGPGGAVAVTYYWYYLDTKEVIDCDTIFDIAEPWSISETVPGDAYDAWNTAAHEAGHFLVLQDLKSPRDGALTMHAYT
jgi:hypothetical protein